jgi:hypothetical protein
MMVMFSLTITLTNFSNDWYVTVMMAGFLDLVDFSINLVNDCSSVVGKAYFSGSSSRSPDRMDFISGIPDPAALGEMVLVQLVDETKEGRKEGRKKSEMVLVQLVVEEGKGGS